MTASIRILTTASLDSSPSLLLISPDGSKTLVNCGEGCQRSFLDAASPVRVSSVNRVCLTDLGHDALGGLPGMILTSADVVDAAARELHNNNNKTNNNNNNNNNNNSSNNNNDNHNNNKNNNNKNNSRCKRDGSRISGEEEGADEQLHLEIVGPEGTRAFLRALRHFMRRDRFRVHAHEGHYDSAHNNNQAAASFAAAKRLKGKKGKKRKQSGGGAGTVDIGFRIRSVSVSYDACDYAENYDAGDPLIQSVPITKQAVSYLFTTTPLPGKFLLDRAQALRVPKGPLYAQLKAGRSVTFVDATTGEERTVASKEVVAESSPGVGVAVLYCPTTAVLRQLQEADAFHTLRGVSAEGRVELSVMVHMTPKSVFRSPEYQSWCRSFGSQVDHLMLHSVENLTERAVEDEDSPFVSAMCGGMRRSFVHGGVFPLPFLSKESNDKDVQARRHVGNLSTIKGCPMMDYILMPRSRCGLDESTVKSLYSSKKMSDLRDKVNESGAIKQASAVIDSEKVDNGSSSGLGELILTGTGSAVPCKHRNVMGMYLRMNNGNGMLLDVGEGTLGQLLRSWKGLLSSSDPSSQISEYSARLKGIKAVWISHPHADHHLGLLRLLSERTAVCGSHGDPLVLMAPPDMFDFLAEYGAVVPEIKHSYIPVDCYDMVHGRENPLGEKLYEGLGITYCASIPVAHCQRAYAVVIDGTPFGRVAYSGDCRPSNRFANVAHRADLLIHEATFENGMEEDAVMKRHSTVGEAIEIATKMKARSLVLTHFSQRYPKIPPLNKPNEVEKAKEIPIAFAFDFMRLTPHTIDLAAKLTPALRLLYPQEEGLLDSEKVVEKLTTKELMAVPGMFAAKSIL